MREMRGRSVINYSRTDSTNLNRDKVAEIKVAVIGAGALGNEVFKNLGLLGVGTVMLIDPDVIEPSNLSRSVFFREAAPGARKTDALYEAGVRFFPDTEWISVPTEIADVSYQDLKSCQVVLGCVDNDLARLELAIISGKLGLPYVDGGLGSQDYWRGRVSVFPVAGPCFGCKLTPTRRRELLQSCQAVNRSCWSATPNPRASTSIMASITAALQVDIGLQTIVDERPPTDSLRSTNYEIELRQTPAFKSSVALQSEACPFHEYGKSRLCRSTEDRQCGSDLLQMHGASHIELDWPICVSARCQSCGQVWNPMRRAAWVRNHAACPTCQSKRFIEVENLSRLSAKSQWASLPMSSIGLPPRHLYSLV